MTKIEAIRAAIKATTDETERERLNDELIAAIQEEESAKASEQATQATKSFEDKLAEMKADFDNKLAEAKAATHIGTVEVGPSPEYKGFNLRRGAVKFADFLDQRGQAQKAAELRNNPDKIDRIMRHFADQIAKNWTSGPVTKAPVGGSDAAGDFLVNDDDRDELLSYARLTSVALRRARVESMESDVTTFPVENAKVSLAFSDPSSAIAATSATFTEATVTAKDLAGYADVRIHLEQDTQTPGGILGVLLSQFVESYGQSIDSAVFAGTGDPVSGIFLSYGQSEVFAAGSTAFSELLVTNMLNAVGKIPAVRRQGAAWYGLRSNVWQYLVGLTDNDGRPLFVNNFAQGGALTGFGYPVEETEYGPASAADTALFVFANLQSFIVGERLNTLQIFRDPYTSMASKLIKYYFFTRVGFANALPNDQVAIVTAET